MKKDTVNFKLRALKDELWECGAEAFTKWDELIELEHIIKIKDGIA